MFLSQIKFIFFKYIYTIIKKYKKVSNFLKHFYKLFIIYKTAKVIFYHKIFIAKLFGEYLLFFQLPFIFSARRI